MTNANDFKSFSLRRAFIALGMVLAFAAPAASALAGTSGAIRGIVSDSGNGTPIAGVHLRISSPSQVVETTTDSHGHYVVFGLQPDDYTITAVKPGYNAQSFSGESVYADQTQVYDLKLTAAPPSGS
jgi:hypothetical protein